LPEEIGHRLDGILSVFVCAMMLTGLMILAPDSAEAFPDNAWIEGNVTDGTNPIEDVYIKVMLFMGNGVDVNWTQTDVNGDYSMMVPGGLSYVVFAADGGYYMVMNTVVVSPGETKVADFTLVPITETADVKISGYVTDEDGDPRSDGHVLGIVNNPIGGDMPYYANVTTPDPSTGYYEVYVIPGLRGGGAAGMDFAGYPMTENGTEDKLEPATSHTFNLELKPQTFNDDAMVYGYVTEVGLGSPLSSAVVSYEFDTGMDRYSNFTLTDEDGYYEMDVVSADNARMTFQKIGYTIKFYEVDVPPAGAVQQDAELKLADAKIRGNVTVEGTGEPVAFGRVFLVDDPMMQGNMTMAVTNFAGQYELDAFAGIGLYFGAEQDGFTRNFTRIDVTSGDELWYNFTLQPLSAWLVGQVTDALSGAPVVSASVHIIGPIEEQQWTDGAGMYNFSLVPGDYAVEANQWGNYKTYYDNITVTDGIENVLDISLVPWQNAVLKGLVYDLISGDPVPGAGIWLSGWWGNSTMADGTGHYELFNVDGLYTVNVNAPGYNSYSTDVVLPELSVTELDIGLLPQSPEQTALLHGFVSNSDDSSFIGGAEVRIRLDGGQYENSTWTDPSGYYEMYVPPWVLNVRATAYAHAPYFGQIDLTGISDYALDVVLDRDRYEPNLTYSQSPLENVSWTNPSLIDVMVEEQYLRDMTLIHFMEWNSSGLDSNWTMIAWSRTSFDPWNPESSLPYSIVDGNYSVNEMWDGSVSGGWLWNGTAQAYLPASFSPWWMEPAYALSGAYTNGTMPTTTGVGLFNVSTGGFMAFKPYGMAPPVQAPDPTGVFEPMDFVIEYDGGIFTRAEWRSLGVWDVNGLMFAFEPKVPSGNCKTEFFVSDWGNQGNVSLNDLTVDNDLPVAYAGSDQNVPENAIVTLDGRGSSDNVGIVSYVWEFYNATDVWTVLTGDVVTYSFEYSGSYDVTLRVSDGAGHWSTDTLTVSVFVDAPPVANAGPDQTVDEDTVVTFDGSGSDDHGVVDYTWTILELSVEMYDVAPQYTFADPGIYHVWLVVTDTVGQLSDPDEMIVTVNDLTPPTAEAGLDQRVNIGTPATLDGSASTDNGVMIDFNWTFVDVVSVELHGMTVDYTFSALGPYLVTLNVTDAGGNWAIDQMQVTVNGPPVADAGGDQLAYAGDWVWFNGWGSWDDLDQWWELEFTWTFEYAGSPVELTGITPWFEFRIPGIYTVDLTVRDTGGLEGTSSMVLTVVIVPSAWWVDPRTGETLVDGARISLDHAVLRGYTDSFEEVDIITPIAVYQVYADADGYFEQDPVQLSEGLNIVTIVTYSDDWGMVVSLFKMIQSDTHCLLWVDSPESPTPDAMAHISGWTDSDADVTVDGVPVAVGFDGTFGTDVTLSEGVNIVNVTAVDSVGNMNWAEVAIELDTTPPTLVITWPTNALQVDQPNVLVYGTVESGAVVRVNGVLTEGGADWSATVSLVEGANTIVVTAMDSVGNTAIETVVVNYVPPVYVTPAQLAALRAELLGEISNLSASLQENVSALQDQIDTAMGEITALQTSLAENISALQAQIDFAMDEILALQTSLAENITALQTQIDAAMDDIAALQASVAENVTALQDQINTAMADIAGLQASLLENVTALQTQITAAMADIVALETALMDNVTALQNQINAAVLDIAALQIALAENVTALQSDIAALEADLQANITALQLALSQNVTALQQALAQNVTTLQSQIAALRSALQANVTALTAALGENVTALDGLIDTLDQDIGDLQSELAAVNSTLTSAQNQMDQAIDSMQTDLADLQQQIDELNQTTQDVDEKAKDTDSFARMLMYLTLILFAIAAIMVGLVWYLTSKKLGRGGAGPPANALEEVEGPTEVEREFESLEKEIKDEEL